MLFLEDGPISLESSRLVWQDDPTRLDDCDGYQHCGMRLGRGPVSLSIGNCPRVRCRGSGSLVGPTQTLQRGQLGWKLIKVGKVGRDMHMLMFGPVELADVILSQWRGVFEDRVFSRVYLLDT